MFRHEQEKWGTTLNSPFNSRLRRRQLTITLACSLLACWQGSVAAQLPSPHLTSLRPAGGAVGSQFSVTVIGTDLDQVTALRFSHPGIQATQLKTEESELFPAKPIAGQFQISIADDVPPGIYEFTAVGRYGNSNPRCFAVDRLNEVAGFQTNNSLSQARSITVNSVVNETATAQATNFYRIPLRQGQRISIECQSRVLGAKLLAAISLYDEEGHEIIRHRDLREQDPWLPFEAMRDMELIVGIEDFLFRGGADFFYRLRIHEHPQLAFAWPPVIASGTTSNVNVYGWNLPDHEDAADCTIARQQLQVMQLKIDGDQHRNGPSITFESPIGSLVEAVDLQLPGQSAASPLPIFLTELPLIVEDRTQDNEITTVEAPAEFVGRFDNARDLDRVRFHAKAGEVWLVEVQSQSLGCTTDPEVFIEQLQLQEDGSTKRQAVAAVDDLPTRNQLIGSNFEFSSDDPRYRLDVSQDSLFEITIRDQFSGHQDHRNFYRLRIRKLTPDFQAFTQPVQRYSADLSQVIASSIVLRPGQSHRLGIQIRRRDGYSGVIKVSPQTLPEGVTCEPIRIDPDSDNGELILHATKDAPPFSGDLTLQATGQVGNEITQRPVWYGTVSSDSANKAIELPRYRLSKLLPIAVLAVDTFPLELSTTWEAAHPYLRETDRGTAIVMSKGGKLELDFEATKHEPVPQNVTLQPVQFPAGLQLQNQVLAPDATTLKVTLDLTNKDIPPGWYEGFFVGDFVWKYPRHAHTAQAAAQEVDRLTKLKSDIETSLPELANKRKTLLEEESNIKESFSVILAAEGELKEAIGKLTTEVKLSYETVSSLRAELAKADRDGALSILPELSQAERDHAAEEQRLASEQNRMATLSLEIAKQREELESSQRRIVGNSLEIAQADLKLKTLEPKLAEAKQVLEKANQANQPIDLVAQVVTNKVRLQIVDTPIVLASEPSKVALDAKQLQCPIRIHRDFGFSGPVEISVTIPETLPGATAQPLSLAADQTEASLIIDLPNGIAAGQYELGLQATASFNGLPVGASSTWQVTVETINP